MSPPFAFLDPRVAPQWFKDGVAIEDNLSAGEKQLILPNVTHADAALYACNATNIAASAVSESATLHINMLPRVTTSPYVVWISPGDVLAASVDPGGSACLFLLRCADLPPTQRSCLRVPLGAIPRRRCSGGSGTAISTVQLPSTTRCRTRSKATRVRLPCDVRLRARITRF